MHRTVTTILPQDPSRGRPLYCAVSCLLALNLCLPAIAGVPTSQPECKEAYATQSEGGAPAGSCCAGACACTDTGCCSDQESNTSASDACCSTTEQTQDASAPSDERFSAVLLACGCGCQGEAHLMATGTDMPKHLDQAADATSSHRTDRVPRIRVTPPQEAEPRPLEKVPKPGPFPAVTY